MEEKQPKIVTGTYVMTILGYVFVIMLAFFAAYVILAYLFGAFNSKILPIEGLKFSTEEVIISENGGTATLSLVSQAAKDQEKAESESEEPVEKGIYSIKSISITVTNYWGNDITSNCPIKLPDMKDISMGKPFEITAVINPEDNANIGGDCYLDATVVDNEGRIWMTPRGRPVHVFVDVPIERIELVKAVGYANGNVEEKVYLQQETIDILDRENNKIGEYDKVNSPLLVTDTVGLEIEVYPARALSPHTAIIYTEPSSPSYIAPKAPFFNSTNKEGLEVDELGKVFVKNKSSDLGIEACIYPTISHTDNVYISRSITFNIESTTFGGVDFDVDKFVTFVEIKNEEGEVIDRKGSINLDLKLQETPVLAFVLDEKEISSLLSSSETDATAETFATSFSTGSTQNELETIYQNLLDKQSVIDLDAGVYASISNSFNVRYPTSLQNMLTSFDITVDEENSGFFTEENPMPQWIKDKPEYTYPVRIEKVGLNENNTAPFIWFVYITREIQEGEDICLKLGLTVGENSDEKSYPLLYQTKKIGINFDFSQVLLDESASITTDVQGTMTLSMVVDKDGDGDNEGILNEDSQEYELTLNPNTSNDASYTRLIYLVKSGKKKGTDGYEFESTLGSVHNLNVWNSRKLKTVNDNADNSKEFLIGDTYYNLLAMDNDDSHFLIKALSGGRVEIYPLVVKTNVYGVPVDDCYNEITPESVDGIVFGDGTDKSDGVATNKYVVQSSRLENGKSVYFLSSLMVDIEEKLSSFSFYNSTDFVEKITSFAYEGSEENSSGITQVSQTGGSQQPIVYALANSRLALSSTEINAESIGATLGETSVGIIVSTKTIGNTTFPYVQLNLPTTSPGKYVLSFSYNNDFTKAIDVNVLDSDQINNKSVVLRYGNNIYMSKGGITIKETINGVTSDKAMLYMYLQNASLPQAFYKTADTSPIYYQSKAINTHYYLLRDKDTVYEIDEVEYSLSDLISTKYSSILYFLNDKTSCEHVDDKILSYDGQIYKINDEVLSKLGDWRLFCIATDYDDIGEEYIEIPNKNVAILEIGYEKFNILNELSIINSDYDETESGYLFGDDKIFYTQVVIDEDNTVKVLTNYGKSANINSESFNLVNFNLTHLSSGKFKLSRKNGATSNVDTLNMTCSCYLGIMKDEVYTIIKTGTTPQEAEVNAKLNISLNIEGE